MFWVTPQSETTVNIRKPILRYPGVIPLVDVASRITPGYPRMQETQEAVDSLSFSRENQATRTHLLFFWPKPHSLMVLCKQDQKLIKKSNWSHYQFFIN